MTWNIAYTQHTGQPKTQQDALWNGRDIFQEKNLNSSGYKANSDTVYAAVADGVSSSPKSNLASYFVLEKLSECIKNDMDFNASLIRAIHNQLSDKYAKGQTFGTTTTLCAIKLNSDRGIALNVGDSRIYKIDNNKNLELITRDHTMLNRLIDEGLAKNNIEYASMYNMLDSYLAADYEDDFSIGYHPFKVKEGDLFLICTDGVYDVLSNEEIISTYNPRLSLIEQTDIWCNAILNAGAHDNFSMILIRKNTL